MFEIETKSGVFQGNSLVDVETRYKLFHVRNGLEATPIISITGKNKDEVAEIFENLAEVISEEIEEGENEYQGYIKAGNEAAELLGFRL